MIDTVLVFSRFVHYSSSLVLFGVALFPLYIYPRNRLEGTGRRNRMLVTCWALSLLVLVSGAFWFIGVATSMADTSASWETARFVLSETTYGAVCLIRLGIVAAVICVLALIAVRPVRQLDTPLATLSAALVASLAGTGHTHVEDGPARLGHMFADALHLVGAGAWLGGLVFLLYLTATSLHSSSPESRRLEACDAAFRFSRMGYLAVGTIIGSGIVNSWFLVSPFANLIETDYGRLLLIKIALFAGMVGLAAVNRFLVVPVLAKPAATTDSAISLRRLRLHVLLEQCFGLAIILIVALLGTMEPAISSSQ
jgi:putative copper resistance protein D